MSAGKVILIGLVGVAAAAVFIGVANASPAKSKASTIPASFKPPLGAVVITIPAGHAGIPFPMTQTSWAVAGDASGAKPGSYVLVQNAQNPLVDWVVTFTDQASGGRGIVAASQTPNGGLMAQAAAAGL